MEIEENSSEELFTQHIMENFWETSSRKHVNKNKTIHNLKAIIAQTKDIEKSSNKWTLQTAATQ